MTKHLTMRQQIARRLERQEYDARFGVDFDSLVDEVREEANEEPEPTEEEKDQMLAAFRRELNKWR